MKYSIRGGWAESTHKTPPARLGRPQRWARMSPGRPRAPAAGHPRLAGLFFFLLTLTFLTHVLEWLRESSCTHPPDIRNSLHVLYDDLV